MKRIYQFVFCFLVFMNSVYVFAQEQKSSDTLVKKAVPMMLKLSLSSFMQIEAGVQMEFERAIGKWGSIQGEFAYLYKRPYNDGNYNIKGYSVGLQWRYYIKNENPLTGLYIAPGLSYRSVSWTKFYYFYNGILGFNKYTTIHIPSLSVRWGYQFIPLRFLKHLAFDVNIEAGTQQNNVETYTDYIKPIGVLRTKDNSWGTYLGIGVSMGWRFYTKNK